MLDPLPHDLPDFDPYEADHDPRATAWAFAGAIFFGVVFWASVIGGWR